MKVHRLTGLGIAIGGSAMFYGTFYGRMWFAVGLALIVVSVVVEVIHDMVVYNRRPR